MDTKSTTWGFVWEARPNARGQVYEAQVGTLCFRVQRGLPFPGQAQVVEFFTSCNGIIVGGGNTPGEAMESAEKNHLDRIKNYVMRTVTKGAIGSRH